MAKTEHIRMRIEPDLKAQAEAAFSAMGLTTSDAISMFFTQVVREQ